VNDDRAWLNRLRRGLALSLALAAVGFVALVVIGGGPRLVWSALVSAHGPWALVALGALALTWLWEALRFEVAARALPARLGAGLLAELTLVNYSAAYVANAGAPATAALLWRRSIPPGEALAVCAARQSLFLPAAILPAAGLLALQPAMPGPLHASAWAMAAWACGAVSLLLIAMFFPAAAERLPRRFVPAARAFVSTLARFFRHKPGLLLASFALAVLAQATFAASCAATLRAMGASGDVWALSFIYVTLVEAAPTPGASGVAEGAGLWLFGGLLAAPQLAAALLAWRLLAVQLPIALGALVLARSLR